MRVLLSGRHIVYVRLVIIITKGLIPGILADDILGIIFLQCGILTYIIIIIYGQYIAAWVKMRNSIIRNSSRSKSWQIYSRFNICFISLEF